MWTLTSNLCQDMMMVRCSATRLPCTTSTLLVVTSLRFALNSNYVSWMFLLSAHALGCKEKKYRDWTSWGERPFMFRNPIVTHGHTCIQNLESNPGIVPSTTIAQNVMGSKPDEVRWSFQDLRFLWRPYRFSNRLKFRRVSFQQKRIMSWPPWKKC